MNAPPRPRQPGSRRWLDPALVIVVVAVLLDLYQWALARPLWLDEEMIALNLRDRSLLDLAGSLWLGQSAPYGWLVLQRVAILVLGTGERALRLVPVLFGIGAIAVALGIGRRWLTRAGSAVLVLLCAFAQWTSYYVLELKQYSGDMFWGLLLPALAASAADPSSDDRRVVRLGTAWWGAAAVGQWFSNGALLATPACAAVVLAAAWRRGGWPLVRRFAVPAAFWVAAFGLHYGIAMRHALNSEFLRDYWSFALPPPDAGLTGTIAWLAHQFEPFAVKPGGTGLWGLFWIACVSGMAWLIATRPALGISFGLMPVSAWAFAAFRFAPLYERLSLWMVPALYLGIAGLADAAARLTWPGVPDKRGEPGPRRPLKIALAVGAGAVASVLAFDVAWRGIKEVPTSRASANHNHQLNDRAAVQWLLAQQQLGDGLLSTHNGLPALWWYGSIPISTPVEGGRLAAGAIILEARRESSRTACTNEPLRDAVKDRTRLLIYLGFPEDADPDEFDDWLVDQFGELGSITASRRFAGLSRALVIELGRPTPNAGLMRPSQSGSVASNATPLRRQDACLAVRPARRW